jgi:hypothetical protein
MRKISMTNDFLKQLLPSILEIPSLRGLNWNLTSAEVVEQVMKKITEAVNNPDPFFDLKFQQNNQGLSLYPRLKKMVKEAADPLQAAVRLAIIGNSIDVMVLGQLSEFEKSPFSDTMGPIPKEAFVAFQKKITRAHRIVYLGDNAGEIIFDRVLIETLQELYHPEILFVARSVPALNDVTLKEVRQVGLDKIVEVIENGLEGPVPGTILSRCSPALTKRMEESDLIISKGGGNFDTLDEDRPLQKDISFMLMSKCLPYCRLFNSRLNQPILANYFTTKHLSDATKDQPIH